MSFVLEEKKNQIREKLSYTRGELINTIKNLTVETLNKKNSNKDESWTIIEALRHLFEAERGMISLMMNINKGSEGVPEDFDLNRYNKRSVQKLAEKNLDLLLDGFKENRIRLFEFLTKISLTELAKKGRHGSLLILTIEQIFNLIGDHEQGHLNKIKSEI
ncbi:MAG: hypothetical protein HeimC3_15670 [Candidatus Heimdallarchaeota archaeon LC_3]|nr:MAG: hypothetical protein HeimC3_15670 [Candidatus Heimdallarchaeota archaeon LC_3]